MSVKCVVFDLDHTLWHGTLLEDPAVELKPGVRELLAELDRRGILCSLASKNDHDAAWQRLSELGIEHYFLYPQIHWNPKSGSVRAIAAALNLGTDSLAFVDDQPYELAEVAHELPEVTGFAAWDELLADPRLNPRFLTPDSSLRRQYYQTDLRRAQAERDFAGPSEEFLATLGMVFEIQPAAEGDLQRSEELTQRTHQLNTTGYTYSYEELDALRRSGDHVLLVARLTDRFGPYGQIGLALVEKGPDCWTLKLLLMSCRVMTRGVGTLLLHQVMRLAREAGARLRAEFRPNGKNRTMLVTYRFGGFREVERRGDQMILEHDLSAIPPWPAWLQVRSEVPCGART